MSEFTFVLAERQDVAEATMASASILRALASRRAVIGRPVAKLGFPVDVMPAAIRRGSLTIILDADTRLEAGDHALLVSEHQSSPRGARQFHANRRGIRAHSGRLADGAWVASARQ